MIQPHSETLCNFNLKMLQVIQSKDGNKVGSLQSSKHTQGGRQIAGETQASENSAAHDLAF